MYGSAIMGEEFEGEVQETSWLDKLGSATKSLLETGSQVYALEQQKKIAEIQRERETLAAGVTEATRRAQIQQAGMISGNDRGLLAPTGGGLPIIPIVIGVGVIGTIAYILARK